MTVKMVKYVRLRLHIGGKKNAVLDNFKENFCIDPNKTC